jgi:hypothetical protein
VGEDNHRISENVWMMFDHDDAYDLAPAGPPPLPARAVAPLVRPAQYPDRTRTLAAPVRADGKLLVVRRGCALPERCIRCNAPAAAMVRVSVAQSEADFKTFLYGFIPYVGPFFRLAWMVRHLMTRDAATLRAGLCPAHRNLRRLGIAIALLGVPVAAAILYAGSRDGFHRMNPQLPFVAAVTFIAFALVGWSFARTLSLAGMDPRTIILRGASRPFLDSLGPIPSPLPMPTRR